MRYLLLLFVSFPAYATVFTLHDTVWSHTAPDIREGYSFPLTGFFEIEQGALKSWHLDSGWFVFDSKTACEICGPRETNVVESPSAVHFFTGFTPSSSADLRLEFDQPIDEGAHIIPGEIFEMTLENVGRIPKGSYLRSGYHFGVASVFTGFIAPEPETWFALFIGLGALCKRYIHVGVKNLRRVGQRDGNGIVASD